MSDLLLTVWRVQGSSHIFTKELLKLPRPRLAHNPGKSLSSLRRYPCLCLLQACLLWSSRDPAALCQLYPLTCHRSNFFPGRSVRHDVDCTCSHWIGRLWGRPNACYSVGSYQPRPPLSEASRARLHACPSLYLGTNFGMCLLSCYLEII
ncbi:hypothetical protein BDV93DRAFT_19806 [Ceratobasidium sp. AG-I]|nr:hypothetical protein BDV93DRAFT_19806 [Ceratobasidium sp. AG-I]